MLRMDYAARDDSERSGSVSDEIIWNLNSAPYVQYYLFFVLPSA